MSQQNNDTISIDRKFILFKRKHLCKFSLFRKYYFPSYNKKPSAPFHKELSSILSDMSAKRGVKTAIAAPRESAKSTVVSLQYVIYCICYRLEQFIILLSNTSDQASNFLNDIKHELEKNDKLIKDFPDVCETGKKPNPPRWSKNEIITRNGIKVLALGAGQQIRGRRNKESRPSLIILDDIETDESFQNPESYYKLQDWLTKAVLKSGTSTTNIIYIGTIHHYNSLLAQFTDPQKHPGWNKKIYRSVISWSIHPELWDTWVKIFNYREEYDGAQGPGSAKKYFDTNKEKMLLGTKVLWPANKSYYNLMVLREQDGYLSFDSEMQNEPVNPRDCFFNLDEIHYWDERYRSDEELIYTLKCNLEFYGSCDPSLGKYRHKGDFSAIISAAVDVTTGVVYVLDADIARKKPHETIDDILAHHKRRNYSKFAFETNQFQEFMAYELEKRARASGLYLAVEQIKHSTDKLGRIESLQPFIKNGTIQFSKRHRALLEQMKFFPKGAHDDGLDALEMIFKLCKDAQDGPRVRWV
jgi:predicted phage terminase large subunit-like protein